MAQKWPTAKDSQRRLLALQTAFADQMLRDAVVMAMYIRDCERPTFLDADIQHVKDTFNLELEKWDERDNERT